jgi:hypothetical protein
MFTTRSNTDLELEGFVPVQGRVELLPVRQGAGVVHRQHVPIPTRERECLNY